MANAADFEHLSVDEKLDLVTQLWNQISASREPLVLPESMILEAEHRVEEMIADPSLAITEEEMWRRVDELRQ